MAKSKRIMFCFGTRPEAIKMAPLVLEAQERGHEAIVCLTGQHKEMLIPFIELFNLPVHENLDIMKEGQGLEGITTSILSQMPEVIKKYRPDIIVVQGDTTSTFTCALAGFYQKVPVAHIEAGLRTHDIYNPFPEEGNRQLTSRISTYHFPPTEDSHENLRKEGVTKNICVTGNTSIDALRLTAEKIGGCPETLSGIDFSKRLILLTSHRRENIGQPMVNIFTAVKRLIEKFEDCELVFPMHYNPIVRETAKKVFDDLSVESKKRIHLISPLDYKDFIYLMKESHLIMSDSGGVQEEAPHLGKPVLVLRETTERPEGIDAGTSLLVGTEESAIFEKASELLSSDDLYEKIKNTKNPYGDGFASQKVFDFLENY